MKLTPDLILFNGRLHTLDDNYAHTTALAVAGQKILAMGNDQEILALAGRDTQIRDLETRRVLPGFWDAHFHFYEWTLNYGGIDFAKIVDFQGMETALDARASKLGPGQWVLGQGFNESEWPENKMPDRHDLDRAAPHNPVCIWRCDLHLAVANSLALELAGIDQHTQDPEGGVIVRDGAGFPNGILKEMAPELIRRVMPPLSESKLMENMEKAMTHAHGLGLTSVHDIRLMGGREGADALGLWQAVQGAGKLNIRCHVALPGEMTDQAVALGLRSGFGNDRLKIGYLKFFADGGMGARTAWMTQPYLDAEFGMPLTPVKEIESAVIKADRAGLACMVHAIGDRACQEIIQMFSRVEQANQSRCLIPHRLEHAQMVLPQDLVHLSRLKNLAISCQPNNLSLDISMIDQCAGPRGQYAYALKSLMNTGLPLMLSSDAPVADPNPFAGIYSAVTRKRMNRTPAQGWYPEQALRVEEAVRAYTLTPARVSGCGPVLGSLTPGKLADLVVIDQDIFKIPLDEIAHTQVVLTLFDGKIVHER